MIAVVLPSFWMLVLLLLYGAASVGLAIGGWRWTRRAPVPVRLFALMLGLLTPSIVIYELARRLG